MTSRKKFAALPMMGVLVVALPSATLAQGNPSIRRINPPTLSTPTGYTHIVEASGGRTLHVSGQVALDSTGTLVGAGDFRAQTEQVYDNLRRALAAAGATFSDVVKMTTFVTDASKTPIVREVRSRYFAGDQVPASTLVEIRALARPEWLIEIEVVAVVR